MKCVGATNENFNFDLRVKRVKNVKLAMNGSDNNNCMFGQSFAGYLLLQ